VTQALACITRPLHHTDQHMSTILVIEDDRQIRRVVQLYLEQAGMAVLTAADGATGLALARYEKPAVIILDLLLPGVDGREITRQLRQSSDPAVAGVHILMLTALDEEQDRINGFMLGADDYLGKPFSPRELVARVQATLRRLAQSPATSAARIVTTGPLRLDPAQRRACRGVRSPAPAGPPSWPHLQPGRTHRSPHPCDCGRSSHRPHHRQPHQKFAQETRRSRPPQPVD
jgi:CheY-like chemotaxis protein